MEHWMPHIFLLGLGFLSGLTTGFVLWAARARESARCARSYRADAQEYAGRIMMATGHWPTGYGEPKEAKPDGDGS